MSDDAPGPDTRRAVLALLCVLGLVAASTAAPALAGDTPLGGLDSPQAPSEVPEFLLEMDALNWLFGDEPPEVPQGSGNLLGALSPGRSTSVGGAIPRSARALASQPHFVATAPGRTYWRTGAYVEYTGSGWQSRDGYRTGDDSNPVRETREASTTYTVTLKRSTTSLPVVWRPLDVSLSDVPNCSWGEDCGVDLQYWSTGSVRAPSGLGPGTTYEVAADKPARSEEVLTAAGDGDESTRGSPSSDYSEVSTTGRVESLADRVTDDASTRYEKATAVESHLERAKRYSLTNGTASGESVVDEFLFEQDAGYCEHFASSMAVMLRTQDIPARYVVGYAGGERVGENQYLVRGADAHAWVEVYFEGAGWVRFDPTPTAARQAADEQLRGPSGYRVGLDQSATPGERVTATVTAAGEPVSGVSVTVNGESVGATDGDGEVAFTVPYAEEIDIDLQGANASATGDTAEQTAVTPAGGVSTTGGLRLDTVGSPLGVDGAGVANVPSPQIAGESGVAAEQDGGVAVQDGGAAEQDGDAFGNDSGENGTDHTFPVNADVSFQFRSGVEPGSTVTLQAFVGSNRFPGATIRLAGERVGQTNQRGVLDVTIPEDASGVLEVTASRGDITQTETYPVDGLVVSVSPSLVAPLPWTEATARVTSGGEAVTDAVVELDGEVVGRTGEGGTAALEIPLSRAPRVSSSTADKHAVTHVDGVLPAFALVSLAALAALAGGVRAVRRRGVTVDDAVALLARAVNEAAAAAVRAVVGFADALEELAAEFRDASRDGWRGVLEWLASLPGRVRVPSVRAWVAGVLAAVRGGDDSTTVAAGTETRSADAGTPGRPQSVWRRFVSLVGVERWETKTPGEVARRAVRSGFPRHPVYALTNAFRDAAYGGRPERAERAESALDELDDDERDDKRSEEGGR